jgi:hypothetical protein
MERIGCGSGRCREIAMLDKPEKTAELVATLTAAVPFEVTLIPDVIALLARQQRPVAVNGTETVHEVSYAGDEGGILCHLQPKDADNVVVVSLTHVRLARALPFAAAVSAYQKHRTKKLRRQNGRR